MNREIKFRGKKCQHDFTYPTKQWVFGYLTAGKIHDDSEPACRIHFQGDDFTWHDVRVIPETVGQFTGLHDKNGSEIYEGDVVRFDYPESLKYALSGVVGVDRYNQWYIRISPEDKEKYGFRTGEFHIDNAVNRGEVAGNIHDTWK